jgi:hypothetical protein
MSSLARAQKPTPLKKPSAVGLVQRWPSPSPRVTATIKIEPLADFGARHCYDLFFGGRWTSPFLQTPESNLSNTFGLRREISCATSSGTQQPSASNPRSLGSSARRCKACRDSPQSLQLSICISGISAMRITASSVNGNSYKPMLVSMFGRSAVTIAFAVIFVPPMSREVSRRKQQMAVSPASVSGQPAAIKNSRSAHLDIRSK